MSKMKNVFEQVKLVDGSRRMRGDIIQKTFKVLSHGNRRTYSFSFLPSYVTLVSSLKNFVIQ